MTEREMLIAKANEEAEAADAAFFLCPFCRYRMETDDAYGCPNCLGEGLDGDDQGEGCPPDKEQS